MMEESWKIIEIDTVIPLYVKCRTAGGEKTLFAYMDFMKGKVYPQDLPSDIKAEEFEEAVKEAMIVRQFSHDYDLPEPPEDALRKFEEAEGATPPMPYRREVDDS
jgi:hypothetical protein